MSNFLTKDTNHYYELHKISGIIHFFFTISAQGIYYVSFTQMKLRYFCGRHFPNWVTWLMNGNICTEICRALMRKYHVFIQGYNWYQLLQISDLIFFLMLK